MSIRVFLSTGIDTLERELGTQDEHFLELQSLISAFSHLPSRKELLAEQRADRLRDKEIHKRTRRVRNYYELVQVNGG